MATNFSAERNSQMLLPEELEKNRALRESKIKHVNEIRRKVFISGLPFAFDPQLFMETFTGFNVVIISCDPSDEILAKLKVLLKLA